MKHFMESLLRSETKPLTPRWFQFIYEFDALEIKPCAAVNRGKGKTIIEPCHAEDADLWTVYGHFRPGGAISGVEAIGDFDTEDEAQKFHDQLMKSHSNLIRRYKQTRHQQYCREK